MNRIRSNSFITNAAQVVGFALLMQSGLASAASGHDDSARLARAYRDVANAEQALRANPAAAAVFGPMLLEAKARLAAGIAAAAQTTPNLDVLNRAVEARADIAPVASDALQASGASCNTPAFPTNVVQPPSKSGMTPAPTRRPRLQTKLLIWV